jgi:hypothetical protein
VNSADAGLYSDVQTAEIFLLLYWLLHSDASVLFFFNKKICVQVK